MSMLYLLAALAVADGVTTHIGLAFGMGEANPLFAALFAASPPVGWIVYICTLSVGLGMFWVAEHSPSCSRRWLHGCYGVAITIKGSAVALNTAQLALWWWLG